MFLKRRKKLSFIVIIVFAAAKALTTELLEDMKALNVQNRKFAIIENGSWACKSGELIAKEVEALKGATIMEGKITLASSLSGDREAELDALADIIAQSVKAEA